MPSLLVGFGCALIAIALFFWREGSGYGLLIAWFFGMWGATFLAWGLISGWYRSAAACIASAVCALAAMVIALAYVQFDAWDMAIMCAIASALALIFAVHQACYLLRRREL